MLSTTTCLMWPYFTVSLEGHIRQVWLYHSGQCYWWRKHRVPRENHLPCQNHWQSVSHKVILSLPCKNIFHWSSSDNHFLYIKMLIQLPYCHGNKCPNEIIHTPLIYTFYNIYCNMNAIFSFDLFMVYIPECKQQLRTMK